MQIARWNENASVATAAGELAAALRARFGSVADPPPAQVIAQARAFLVAWRPTAVTALAAPGLSHHGQARAFDFQVQQGGRIVAGTSSAHAAEAWDAAGWTEKLERAVRTASTHFEGPLVTPHEPWHYIYRP